MDLIQINLNYKKGKSMNIKDAKEQIKNAMKAYFTKDEYGDYIIPIENQRPVFLIGPPGIGKTAIMKQIASEINVGLISYSMTHHTRQSALGLPFILQKNYGGKEYSISEYTMSEIIASVYDYIELSGMKEGILFLDEINCTSETLAPIMLQFLQYKTFGKHSVPQGWIVVTAGNPPAYNNSVREFDIVTWDRLKRIDVEPDFDVWKEYAYSISVHPSIITYLEMRKNDFYKVETTIDGKSFVTARGWIDLSQMMTLYEKNNIKIDEKLTTQYLQNKKIASEFALYYDLFIKYRSDYQINEILSGKVGKEIKNRAKDARFDERVAVLGLLLGAVNEEISNVLSTENVITILFGILKQFKKDVNSNKDKAGEIIKKYIEKQSELLIKTSSIGTLSNMQNRNYRQVISILEEEYSIIKDIDDNKTAFKEVKKDFDNRVANMNIQAAETGQKLTNIFHFCEEVFTQGQELLIFITELTINKNSALFISKYGCEAYFKHNKELLFYERSKEIIKQIDGLEL